MPRQIEDKFIVRMPAGMRSMLKYRASQARRSMNSEILLMIERALASASAATGETLQGETPAAASNDTALAGGPIHQRS